MGWFEDLFGGDESRTDNVKYPDWYSDPNFDATQEFLKTYSQDLLTKGPNDYYAPIGNYGTPEFMDFMNQSNAATLAGVDEATARGRGRGGRTGEVAAQALGDKNASVMYADYVRAMKGRETLLNTGLNTQMNVRDAGFKNQGARNDFNVVGATFDFEKAKYGDEYDAAGKAAIGKMLSTLAPIAGAGIGFMAGGPLGASAGYSLGSSLTGGTGSAGDAPQWLDILNQSKTKAAAPAVVNGSVVPNGVSNIGRIDPSLLTNSLKFSY